MKTDALTVKELFDIKGGIDLNKSVCATKSCNAGTCTSFAKKTCTTGQCKAKAFLESPRPI